MISDQGNWAKHQKGAFFDLVNVYRKLAENSLSDIAATYFQTLFRTKKRLKRRKRRSPSEISLSSSSVKRSRWLVSGLRCYLSISLRTFHMFHTSTTTTLITFPSPRNVITFGHNYPTTQCISLIFNNKKIYDNKKRFRRVRGDNMFHFSQIVDLALSMQRFPFR